MYWIMYRPGEAIPKELFYPNCESDKNKRDRTPLMLWIIHREGEAIPKELYYPGC